MEEKEMKNEVPVPETDRKKEEKERKELTPQFPKTYWNGSSDMEVMCAMLMNPFSILTLKNIK